MDYSNEFIRGFASGWITAVSMFAVSMAFSFYRVFRHRIFGPKFKAGDVLISIRGRESWEAPVLMRIEGLGKNKYQIRYFFSEHKKYGPSTFAFSIWHVDHEYKLIDHLEEIQWMQ